ncbi:MAG: YabP/YqfC family sporulation protein [Oscillospiraceae bacterium]|nr:YabP/YqfC family sporulation protein [Oscillospiraceae bacterium]
MEWGHGFLERIAEGMDLPGESFPGQSILEIAGDNRVLIEHHFGVVQYSREKISVKVKFGEISVCGHGLELARMTKQQLVICGRIDCVTLQRRGK